MESIKPLLCSRGSTELSKPRCAALLAATAAASWVVLRKLFQKSIQRFRTVPGLPYLGVALKIDVDKFVELNEEWAKEYGGEGVFEYTILGTRMVALCSWEIVEPVIAMRPFKVKKPSVYGRMGVMTNGIFFSEGDQWRRERRLMAPAFNVKNVEQYAPAVNQSLEDLLTVLERENEQNGEVNFSRLLMHFTSEVIQKVAWGYEEHSQLDGDGTIVDDIEASFEALGARSLAVFPYYLVPGLGRLVDGGEDTMARLDKRISTVTEAMAGKGKATVVEKLRKEGEQFTPEELMGNLRNLLLAGSDTTTQALSWIFYNLARMQELQSQVAAEVCALKEVPLSPEHLEALPLVKAVWLEGLRLHGAAPFDEFTNAEPLTVAGREVPAGSDLIVLYRYMMKHTNHVRALLGEDMDDFRPSRWLGPEGVKKLPAPFDTLAFGTGSRICLGMRLADFEGRLTIVRVLRSFHLKPWTGPPLTEKTSFVPKPNKDVKISLEPRS